MEACLSVISNSDRKLVMLHEYEYEY